MIRPVSLDDAPALCDIYNHYVLETPISFEEVAVAPEEMRRRIVSVTSHFPWLVYEDGGKRLGYAYATKWRERHAYRFTVEATVYLHPLAVGKGRGSNLLDALLTDLRKREVHSVIGVIALPNEASVALFQKFGFRQAAHFKQVGYKFGGWIDVGNWQLVLERTRCG